MVFVCEVLRKLGNIMWMNYVLQKYEKKRKKKSRKCLFLDLHSNFVC